MNSCNPSTVAFNSSKSNDICPASSLISSSLWGTNSCSGGSKNLIVAGLPSKASYIALKSPFCIGRSFESDFLLSSSVLATIISLIGIILSSSKNICSVLHNPIPSAPNSTACFVSLGVSALVLTWSFLISSAHDINVAKYPDISGVTVLIASP